MEKPWTVRAQVLRICTQTAHTFSTLCATTGVIHKAPQRCYCEGQSPHLPTNIKKRTEAAFLASLCRSLPYCYCGFVACYNDGKEGYQKGYRMYYMAYTPEDVVDYALGAMAVP